MPKRLYQPDGLSQRVDRNMGWSIGSSGLTPAGQSELLKQLGHQLQAGYQGILKEPTPERMRLLLEQLEECRRDEDGADV